MSLSSDGAGRGDLPLQETVQPDVSTDDTSTDGCHQTTKCGGDKLAAKDKKRSFTALKRCDTFMFLLLLLKYIHYIPMYVFSFT